MNTVDENLEESGLALVHLRNRFYRQKLHQILGIYLLSLIANAILVGIIMYLIKHPTEPYYFPADELSKLIQEVPLQQPNMSLEQTEAWTIAAVESAYSYDFLNFHAQFQDAQKFFTDYGWRQYMQGLQASNNLLSLKQYKYVVIAKVVNQPKLLTQGILTGAASWKFEMPILVEYWMPPYNEKSKFENALTVTAIVQRQDVLQSYKGLGVLQMNATMPTQ